ncbi:AlkA N-terminal domain-containing protein [Streptomyces sp. NPDC059153]|uniref:AlkA N-terminal domain-containing protein n=1 Tax=Streptomyces sp. NPDC059153 TaxID=3346743 RepID=UPI0036C24EE9
MTPTTLRTGPAGPFDHDVALATLTAHHIEGLHAIDPERAVLQRWIDVDGRPVAVTLRVHAAGVTVGPRGGSRALDQVVCDRVRGWFDLGADIAAIDAVFAADLVLGPLVAERLGGADHPVPQRVRSRAVHRHRAAGVPGRRPAVRFTADRRLRRRRPRPRVRRRSAHAPGPAGDRPSARRGTARKHRPDRRRARTSLAIAELFADLDDTENLPGHATLAAAYGVGPWTLDYLAVRAGTDPDAFPAGDTVLRRVLAARGAADPAAAAEDWRPWRSYAASRLWAAA